MRIACVLTTIQTPFSLATYAKAASKEVHFFIVGDKKTPDYDVVLFLETNSIPHSYYGFDYQAKLGFKSHEAIPANCVQRRNIGFLEALRQGFDLIVSIDDDNLILDESYFDLHELAFLGDFYGLGAGHCAWFDIGQHLQPPARQRGFPFDRYPYPRYEPMTGVKVGANAGICLGDPDVSAVDRLSQAPISLGITEVLRAGFVTQAHTYAPFNSQNTAILRKFVPAFGMVPFVGRFDDIYASLIAQRVMWEHGHVVHFGPPMVYQQRNEHDLIIDLNNELEGYRNVKALVNALDALILKGRDVIEDTRIIWNFLASSGIVPEKSCEAMLVYLDDCEKVL